MENQEQQEPEYDRTSVERVCAILRKAKGINATDALALTAEIEKMAAANLIERFKSEQKAQTVVFKTGMAALNSKFNMLLWMFGTLIALGLVSVVSDFF